MDEKSHKAGYINIIGLPNAGKSTLTNALMGWELSIVNRKPQTTRHRIHAIINGEDYQMIVADTPGYIEQPEYAMQEMMNKSALSITDDADVILMVHDIERPAKDSLELFKEVFIKADAPCIIVLNKTDLVDQSVVLSSLSFWSDQKISDHVFPCSAEKKSNIESLKKLMVEYLPEHPPYFSKDDTSDRNIRFFVSEIIRNKIMDQYQREVPYSAQVEIEEYKESQDPSEKTHIRAIIYVLRNSQRQIMIGKGGSAIKRLGMAARKEIEKFIGEPIYLDLTVKLKDNWRDDEKALKRLGYY